MKCFIQNKLPLICILNDSMIFKFKEPSEKTKEIMSQTALNPEKNYAKEVIKKIQKITSHENVLLTNNGNASINLAISSIENSILIPDQGAWNGFKQIAKLQNKEIITLKTEQGIINPDQLKNYENTALILTSFAGYSGEQNLKEISEICKQNNITLIEDASGGLGDTKQKLGNGKYSDIIIASTGSPKIVNVGSGGLLSTNNDEILEKTKILQKITKTNEIVASGMYSELEDIDKKLELTFNATSYLKNNLENVIHADLRGLNVIIKDPNPKELSWNLKQNLIINKSGFITKCPNYNRIKEKAVAIEIKNLDYDCLKREYLNEIIEEINKFKN